MFRYNDGYNLLNRFLSSFLNEIFYGGYYSALTSPSLILSVVIILNISCDLPIMAISYLLPLIVYSYDYYKDLDDDQVTNSQRTEYLSKKVKIYPFVLLFYVLLLISLLIVFSNYNLDIFIIGIVVGGILYSGIFKKITKKIPFFKNIYTALTWAMGGTFFIIFYYSMDITFSFLLVFVFIFLRVLINIIFFDLKDIDADQKKELKTLPVLLGKQGSIKFLCILNLFSFLPLWVGIYYKIFPLCSFMLIIFYFYDFYYIVKSKNLEGEDLHNISHKMADSEFILWPILLMVSKMIII